MKKNQYCILNKQYSEVEYKRLLPKIIAHMQTASEWGEFFPEIHSPFPYNESLAHQYYPLTQESVEAKGWKWVERVDEMTDVKNRIAPQDLPRDIQDISDDILQSAIVCKETGHPFKITKSELSFYRKMNLSIPHIHPDERHARRMALLHPRKLFAHICNKCQKPIQTTFQPDHSESIYCEECYLEDVY